MAAHRGPRAQLSLPATVIPKPEPGPYGASNLNIILDLLDGAAAIPGNVAQCGVHPVEVNPDTKHVSTSYAETAKSQYQSGQSPNDTTHQRIVKESRKPCSHDGNLFHTLQFRAHPSNFEDDISDGG